MIILQRWPGYSRENGHVTEVVTLRGGRMVMLQRWSLEWRENGRYRCISLLERIVMLHGWSV